MNTIHFDVVEFEVLYFVIPLNALLFICERNANEKGKQALLIDRKAKTDISKHQLPALFHCLCI